MSQGRGKKLAVLTWNVQWGRGCDGKVDLGRIAEVARAMDDPDVLCFQEIAVNYEVLGTGDQVAELAGLFPGFTVVFRPAIDAPASGRAFGNIILSRLPVLQVMNHLLPRPAEPDVKTMQRQALEAVVAAPFGPVRVLSTHLEFYSATHRAAQVAALARIEERVTARARLGERRGPEAGPYESLPRPAMTALCGDFNFEPSWPEYAALTETFRDTWRVLHPSRPHDPTCGVHDRAQWKDGTSVRDFVFLSDDLARRAKSIRVDVATDASDHQPVLATFE
jgi:endonuclease/exonuclease/phosphatase family metal-dependent hydrolase